MTAGKVTVGHPVDVASGEMFDLWDDAFIPGAQPIAFTRRYSTSALGNPPGPFGKGWTANYFASLRKEADAYVFTTPEGAPVRFPDPGGAVWAGKPVRNLGAFSELVREGGLLTVITWSPQSHTSERFQFLPGESGKLWPLQAHLDDKGNAVDIAWDGQGRIVHARQRREKRSILFRYNDLGRISELEITGENARRLQARYTYDAAGRLTRVENAGATETFEYDDKDRIVRMGTRTGGEFNFTYDDQGRCLRAVGKDGYYDRVFRYLSHLGWTEVTDSAGQIWRYEYLPSGQVIRTLSPMGVESVTKFDDEGRILEEVDGNGNKFLKEYSEAGDYASVTNALGEVTRFEHNARHQLTRLIDALGHPWELEYDSAGRTLASTDAMGDKWTCTLEADGQPAVIRNSMGHERRFTYDANGNVAQWTDWQGGVYAYAYDGLGRALARTDPLGRTTRFTYDDKDNVTNVKSPSGEIMRMEYDAAGLLVASTDTSGKITRYKWGTCGRLLKSIDPSGAARKYWWTNEPDRLAKVIDAKGREYRFEYDGDGRPVRETDFEGKVFEREFDNAFNLVLTRDPAGLEIAMEYDPLHRVIKKTLPDGAEESYQYGPRAQLLSATNPDATIGFAYDKLGRVIKESRGDFTVESEYDAVHNRVLCRSSLGHEARFAYGPNRDLVSLLLDGKHDIAFARDAMGRETRRDLSGGPHLDQSWDVQDRMLSQSVEHPSRGRDLAVAGGSVESYVLGPAQSAMRILRSFTHAPDGSSFRVDDAHRGLTDFGYDTAGRLTSASRASGRSESFTYDSAGNPTRFVRLPGPRDEADADHGEQDCEYGPGNLLLRKGDTRFEYDDSGRMIRKTVTLGGRDSVWEFAWNGAGLMASAKTPDGGTWLYTYDPFGRRISKQSPEGKRTVFVWDGDTLLHDIDPEGNARSWTFDDTVRPISVIEKGEVGLFVNDPIGLPQEILKSDGTIAWAAAYASWGRVDSLIVAGMDNPVRFPGQWFDAETGLHYNRFRTYDPSVGRYLTPDPIRIEGGLNAYQYAPSPTHWQDPFGLETIVNPGAKRGQEFVTTKDSMGRVTRTEGPLAAPKNLPESQRLDKKSQRDSMPNKVPGDDAGHLIGNQFGGPGNHDNLVGMCRTMNQNGTWKKMENQLAKIANKRGNSVEVVVNVHYDGDDMRPSKFTVTAKITDKDGNETTRRWLHTNC